ncbi:MAG: ribosome silencing factor [Candidatus Latescibacteria bacterium]|nr:ribosome silencing factor [Candidatus Latescibacterota bacterium]
MTVENSVDTERSVANIIEHIMEKKGEDIVVIDLRGVTGVADFFVIATGASNVQVKAITDEIHVKLKKEDGSIPLNIEGYQSLRWVLLDYVDVVVHVFDRETRNYYSLETLWKDARIRRVETDYE